MDRVETPCENCSTPFLASRKWQRFCGTACRSAWHRKDKIGPAGRIAELEQRVGVLEEQVGRLVALVVP